MRGLSFRQRLMWLFLLSVMSISLTFSQVGFIGVSLPHAGSFYVVSLLVPMTLAALTLGVGGGVF
ncbi:MAG: hypothetical protein IJ781_05295, partial [Atopobiaceae bacterium]|nr:hypothetical protein [Atopobiaceae bacterium]